jgi:dGTPase
MSASPYPDDFFERHLGDALDAVDTGGRSPFERDRDRVLYSSAFRALAGKTQVVASTELGFLHNRLTHSLKVAQVGKALASRLANQNGAKVDPVLVETACLAHDIGHPPFGHAGEVALDQVIEQFRRDAWEKKNTDREGAGQPVLEAPPVWDGFEGNAQNLRVLTRLATHKSYLQPGLHLTRASLLATTKYPWTRHPDLKGGKKWGAYEGDKDTLDWLILPEGVPVGDQGHPPPMFEKQIMDWADDVTYAVHDVDDWYRLGRIPLHDLFDFKHPHGHANAHHDATPELRAFLAWVAAKWKKEQDRDLDQEEVIRELHLLYDCVHVSAPYDATRDSKGLMEATVSDLICFFVDDVTFTGAGCGYDGKLVLPPQRRLLCDVLQELVWYYVIKGPALAAQQHGQQRIVTRLTEWIYEDWERLLPRDRLAEIEGEQDLPGHGDIIRAIADHVASLTEPMALSLYGKLSGNALGNITDSI